MDANILLKTMTAVSFLAMAGCTTMDKSDAMDTERVLAAAGFQMKFADTPAQKEQMKKLPQRKIAHLNRHGKLTFVYADSQFCKCMYVGTQTEYQRFEKLSFQRDMAVEESIAAEDAAMDWGAWGEWY